jgi:hypothetical protein
MLSGRPEKAPGFIPPHEDKTCVVPPDNSKKAKQTQGRHGHE